MIHRKGDALLFCSRLFVPLLSKLSESTVARQKKEWYSFVLFSLIRTFADRKLKAVSYEQEKRH
jgi:hypothetical protein